MIRELFFVVVVLVALVSAFEGMGVVHLPPAALFDHIAHAAEPARKTGLRIMPLGDSITFGSRIPGYGGYRNVLGTLLAKDGNAIDFVGSQRSGNGTIPDPDNEGHPAWTIPQIKNGIDSNGWLEAYRPDIILLHIGTNDLVQGDGAAAPGNLSALLDDILVRLPQTHVIVAQIIPFRTGPSPRQQSYNAAVARIVASKGPRVSMVDMQNLLSPGDYGDAVHPNAGGYDKMARAWESAIRKVPAYLHAGGSQAAPFSPPVKAKPPVVSYVAGEPEIFATHAELESYGFAFGPSDGQFGAIPAAGDSYTFYGTAGSSYSCGGTTANAHGAFTFTGTLDRVTGSNGCRRLFGPGDGPRGWIFNRDYAGGGQVVRFKDGDRSGWLMPFHGEVWWKNPATPDHKCEVAGGSGSKVNCFYSSLGLAVSTDNGKSFKVVGQILEPSQPMSVFTGSGKNMAVGYGSLIVADANGKHLDNPPRDASGAYFYLFFLDHSPGLPGACAVGICMGVARAPYAEVVAAALSGDPHRVARVFRKYDGASPDPWTQPATSDTPDLSGRAGTYAPLWTDEPGGAQVIYDSSLDLYLTVYQFRGGIKVRASSDLIHWSGPIGAPISEPGRTLYYPTLVGETGDPTIAGRNPRIYYSSFPVGLFPNYKTSVFKSVRLTLSGAN